MKNKTVSNLLNDIGKARDLIQEGDINKIFNYCPLFLRIQETVRKQVSRFFNQDNYTLDFNMYDLKELSDEAYDFIKNYQYKFTFDGLEKDLEKEKKIDWAKYDKYTEKWAKLMKVDTYLRSLYKSLAYVGTMIKMYEDKEENKPLDEQITNLLISLM